jgi:hypothetical protein
MQVLDFRKRDEARPTDHPGCRRHDRNNSPVIYCRDQIDETDSENTLGMKDLFIQIRNFISL